jgi:hypothetical protein
VPAIDHLLGTRSAFGGSAQVFGRAITADHFHARMTQEPAGKGVGASVRKEINRSMTLQIHQDRAIGSTPLERSGKGNGVTTIPSPPTYGRRLFLFGFSAYLEMGVEIAFSRLVQ